MSDSSLDKALLAFLNGISKRVYFGDKSITDEFLRDEVLKVPEDGECSISNSADGLNYTFSVLL